MHIGTGLPAVPPYLPRNEATLWIVGAPESPFTFHMALGSHLPELAVPIVKKLLISFIAHATFICLIVDYGIESCRKSQSSFK